MPDSLSIRLGPYELVEQIAQGAFGEVYKARHVGAAGFQRILAIKRLKRHVMADPAAVRAFEIEARIGGLLVHHNIAQTLEFNEHGGHYYLAMEYVDGVSFQDIIAYFTAAQGSVAAPIALELAAQACDGLHFAHEARQEDGQPLNLVHRDIKPSNLMLTRTGVVKVMDFGIARVDNQTLTDAGYIKGTPRYLSPEIIGSGDVDRRSDLFSLSTVLYELLSLKYLFDAPNLLTLMSRVREADVKPQLKELAKTHKGIANLLRKTLTSSADARFSTGREMARELRLLKRELAREDVDLEAFAQEVMDGLEKQRQQLFPTSSPPKPEASPSATPTPADQAPRSVLQSAEFPVGGPSADDTPDDSQKKRPQAGSQPVFASRSAADRAPVLPEVRLRTTSITVDQLFAGMGSAALPVSRKYDLKQAVSIPQTNEAALPPHASVEAGTNASLEAGTNASLEAGTNASSGQASFRRPTVLDPKPQQNAAHMPDGAQTPPVPDSAQRASTPAVSSAREVKKGAAEDRVAADTGDSPELLAVSLLRDTTSSTSIARTPSPMPANMVMSLFDAPSTDLQNVPQPRPKGPPTPRESARTSQKMAQSPKNDVSPATRPAAQHPSQQPFSGRPAGKLEKGAGRTEWPSRDTPSGPAPGTEALPSKERPVLPSRYTDFDPDSMPTHMIDLKAMDPGARPGTEALDDGFSAGPPPGPDLPPLSARIRSQAILKTRVTDTLETWNSELENVSDPALQQDEISATTVACQPSDVEGAFTALIRQEPGDASSKKEPAREPSKPLAGPAAPRAVDAATQPARASTSGGTAGITEEPESTTARFPVPERNVPGRTGTPYPQPPTSGLPQHFPGPPQRPPGPVAKAPPPFEPTAAVPLMNQDMASRALDEATAAHPYALDAALEGQAQDEATAAHPYAFDQNTEGQDLVDRTAARPIGLEPGIDGRVFPESTAAHPYALEADTEGKMLADPTAAHPFAFEGSVPIPGAAEPTAAHPFAFDASLPMFGGADPTAAHPYAFEKNIPGAGNADPTAAHPYAFARDIPGPGEASPAAGHSHAIDMRQAGATALATAPSSALNQNVAPASALPRTGAPPQTPARSPEEDGITRKLLPSEKPSAKPGTTPQKPPGSGVPPSGAIAGAPARGPAGQASGTPVGGPAGQASGTPVGGPAGQAPGTPVGGPAGQAPGTPVGGPARGLTGKQDGRKMPGGKAQPSPGAPTVPSSGGAPPTTPARPVPQRVASAKAPVQPLPQGTTPAKAPVQPLPQGGGPSGAPAQPLPQGTTPAKAPVQPLPQGGGLSSAPAQPLPRGGGPSSAPAQPSAQGAGTVDKPKERKGNRTKGSRDPFADLPPRSQELPTQLVNTVMPPGMPFGVASGPQSAEPPPPENMRISNTTTQIERPKGGPRAEIDQRFGLEQDVEARQWRVFLFAAIGGLALLIVIVVILNRC